MTADPFAAFRADVKPSDEAFAKLDELLTQLIKAGKAVAEAEIALKNAQEERRSLEEQRIPEYMEGLGLKEFKTTSGLEVQIVKKIRASIGSRKVQAFKWLIDNGHSGLIKRTVMVAFNAGDGEKAKKLVGELRGRDDCAAGVKQEMKVEAASLTSFVKKRLEAGKAIPKDVFGVFEQKFAKVQLPK